MNCRLRGFGFLIFPIGLKRFAIPNQTARSVEVVDADLEGVFDGFGEGGGDAGLGGDGGIELAGGGEAVAREEEGLVPDFGFGAEPGEFRVETGLDGFGQGGGPTAGDAGADEGFEFLQGGGGGLHLSLRISQTVGCGGPS